VATLDRLGPDEVLLPIPSDLQTARDPVLSRAVTIVGGELPPEANGALFPKEKARHQGVTKP
jgi:hypothetical protein